MTFLCLQLFIERISDREYKEKIQLDEECNHHMLFFPPSFTRSLNGKPIAHCMTWMRMIQLSGEGWLYDPALSPWLFLHIYSHAEVKTCASPDPPTAATTTISTTCLNSRTWESTSGSRRRGGLGASLVTLQFPPACHRLSFPWEFTEPCVHVQVNTFTTSGINIVFERVTLRLRARINQRSGGKKNIFSRRSIWRCE